MLPKIKLALRYKNELFDNEILMYVNSCTEDLILAGIDKSLITEEDYAIVHTATAFCKWQLNFQGKGAEWEKIYKGLKTSLALNTKYTNVD